MNFLLGRQPGVAFSQRFEPSLDPLTRRADARDALGFAQEFNRFGELLLELDKAAGFERAELQDLAIARTEGLAQIVVFDRARPTVAAAIATGLDD